MRPGSEPTINPNCEAHARHHPDLRRDSPTRRLTRWDVLAILLTLGLLVFFAEASRHLLQPLSELQMAPVSLAPGQSAGIRRAHDAAHAAGAGLCRSSSPSPMRRFAAKSRRAEVLLVPLLDILQSVPILGFISVTVVFFMSLAPGRVLGAEFAAIFAIFTSQAWNMAFSFYQSLRTVPVELVEASRTFRLSPWMHFWRVEAPFAMPQLIWNMMMSMSGSWFFVVASEAISVGNTTVTLPGVGSYIALAIEQKNLTAVGWAIGAMLVVILLYDQLLFRPLVAWADRFRFEQQAGVLPPQSWVLDVLRRSRVRRAIDRPAVADCGGGPISGRCFGLRSGAAGKSSGQRGRWGDRLWTGFVVVLAALALVARRGFRLHPVFRCPTRPRRSWLGLGHAEPRDRSHRDRHRDLGADRRRWSERGRGSRNSSSRWRNSWRRFRPTCCFRSRYRPSSCFKLNPDIWLSPLMILGTQWYILFNVIAGASSIPSEMRDIGANLQVRGWLWWKKIALPAVFPYYVTGAITASGGSWNASIVAEVASWGDTQLQANGLGAYIAQATEAGDFPASCSASR